MDKRLKNAVVGQSGGPTAAINATLAGVILGAEKAHSEGKIGTLYGMKNGIDGLQNGMIVDLASFFEDQAKIELLSSTPAAALGSCRKKLPKVEEGGEIYDRVFSVLKENQIGYFFYIGGNDSMDTVAKMNAYAQKIGYDLTVIGVPKTIDNDLVGTDHTPGFGSAAKYIATTVQEIICDCAV
ncbi:MAG: 6-phosphofructokinase, partial [Clostridia bacterium]|nr:6-phosphofructokinase [Clostridia bacterium]